jgi:uncharacterized membrane protein YsdA (DUF1294 family)
MNKTWTRIVIVVVAAAAVAFWVFFDRQRARNGRWITPSTRCPPGR